MRSGEAMKALELRAPEQIKSVKLSGKVTVICPLNGELDICRVTIAYTPYKQLLEAGSVARYLAGLEGEEMYAEALAVQILTAVDEAINPKWVDVVVGHDTEGVVLEVTATS